MADCLNESTTDFCRNHPRSQSLGNIEQYNRSPSRSPKTERQTSLLSATSYTFRFKGLKKKLIALKLSKSNTDIPGQTGSNHEQHKLQPAYSGNTLLNSKSPRDSRKHLSKDEMRKKSCSENNNGTTASLYDQFAAGGKTSVSEKTDITPNLNCGRNSIDSTDQFIIVDTVGFDDSLEDANSAYETDDVDGTAPPVEYTAQEIDRLQKKIEKTREELIRMQATKDENVKEYLKFADNTAENAANQKTKINFEKSNQKTNLSIQLLQRKLEKYQLQLKELDERGIHGPRRIIRAVQDSMRSGASSISGAVSKPLESINQFMKKDKKSSSTDNVSITVTQNDDDMMERNYYTSMTNNNSDDENNSSSSSNHLAAPGSLEHSGENDQQRLVVEDGKDEKMEHLVKENEKMNETVSELKETLARVMESLQKERYETEQIRSQQDDMLNQLNDLTELHQNEMMDLKQEMDRTAERIECVEYRFAERAGEIEEAVDSCGTRIHKMELQQHQNQQLLLSVDSYFDGSGNAKLLLSKVLSLIISVFAILLVVISTISRIVMPFASTRMRVITSIITITTLILLWKKSDTEFVQTILYFVNELFRPLYNRVHQRDNTNDSAEHTVDS